MPHHRRSPGGSSRSSGTNDKSKFLLSLGRGQKELHDYLLEVGARHSKRILNLAKLDNPQ